MKHQFEPHRINQDQLVALHDTIIVSDMQFDQRLSQGGLILFNDNGTGEGIRPRWGKVYAVGPEQKDVTVGQWIMVDHGRWTRGINIEDEHGERTIRRVDPKDVLLISDEVDHPKSEGVSRAVHINRADRFS